VSLATSSPPIITIKRLKPCFQFISYVGSSWKRRVKRTDGTKPLNFNSVPLIILTWRLREHLGYDYTLITNLMHWLLFIYKILFSSTCFEHQVLIFRRIQLYTCSIWYCHSSWWPVHTQLAAYRQATRNSYREWRYHMLDVYNYVLLKMSTWCSKHVEKSNILRINNSQCIKLVINV